MPSFGTTSATRLASCERELVVLCSVIVVHFDITVLEGHRSMERQLQLYASGATKTMESAHLKMPARAVDIAPWPIPKKWGADEWKERVKFYEMLGIAQYEAARLGIGIRTGADWDQDGDYTDQTFDDLVHIELT